MMGIDCGWARRRFPELADGSADAAVRDHIDHCVECGREWRAFEEVLQAADELSRNDVPDPGQEYWDRFLPSVRSRIDRAGRHGSGFAGGRIAAAAALILLAALAALMMRPGSEPSSDPDIETLLEKVITSIDARGDVPLALLEPDPTAGLAIDLPEVDPEEILSVIDDLSAPRGISGLWADEDLEHLLNVLDEEQASRLREEIAGETG